MKEMVRLKIYTEMGTCSLMPGKTLTSCVASEFPYEPGHSISILRAHESSALSGNPHPWQNA